MDPDATEPMLINQKPDDIASLIDKCDEAAGLLRELRGAMLHPGPNEIELNATKIETFLGYAIDWAQRAKAKHRNAQIGAGAIRKREEIAKKRKKRKPT